MNNCTEPYMRYFSVCLLAASTALASCSAPGPVRRPSSVQAAPTPHQAMKESSDDQNAQAEARFQDALQLLQTRQYAQSRELLLTLRKDFPNLSGPATNLGIVYTHLKQPAKALLEFQHAVSANPNNAVAWNWIGILNRESGQYVAAEQAYRRALAARPTYAAAQLNLAMLYDVSMNRPQDALAAYQAFQNLSDEDDLIVSAWIRKIESGLDQKSTPTHLAEVSQ